MTPPTIQLPERYRVIRHVASGGMAAVYAAEDELLGRRVAIKVISPAFSSDDHALRRFTREARAAARVSDHPHVVTIYDIGEAGHTPGPDGDQIPHQAFIVMELLPGGTVNDRLKSGDPIPHGEALRWLDHTAAALDAAHAADVVHRDVKPANLLFDDRGDVRVADFGIATLASETPVTQTGQVVGTAAYLSPEQAMGKPATSASDRYALAVVAFELLTGRRPFPAAHPAAQARAHVDTAPPEASGVAKNLPPRVDAVLARGMAKDPEERPPTAGAFVDELRAALVATATTAAVPRAAGAARPVGVAIPDPDRPPTPRPDEAPAAVAAPPAAAALRARVPREPSRREPVRSAPPARSRLAVVAAIAALALVAGAAIAAFGGGGGGGSGQSAGRSATTSTHARSTPRRATTSAAAPPSSTAPTTTAAAAPAGDKRAAEARGHAQIAQGDLNGAISTLQGVVGDCPPSTLDPCAFALFDLGHALRLAGRPDEAIPYLKQRLANPNQQAAVQRELDLARAQAGGGGAAPAAPGKKPKGAGKDKGD